MAEASDGENIAPWELEAFAKLLNVFLGCDAEDREGIASMASIVIDPDATRDEIEAAIDTLRECLYPTS